MRPIRVMLVDDEEPARDRLRDMLGAFDDVRCSPSASSSICQEIAPAADGCATKTLPDPGCPT